MSKEIKLGFFIVLAVSVFMVLIFMLGDFSIGKYYTFSVYFSDVSGLPVKAPIKICGVQVGTVADIQLENGEARVIAKIKKGIVIYKNAEVNVVSTGVVGSKYLEIMKGEGKAEVVLEGDSIRGVTPYSMEKVLAKVVKVFDGFTSNGNVKDSAIYKTIHNLEQITDKINKGLGKDSSDFREIVLNVKATTKSLKNITGDIEELVGHNKSSLQTDIDKIGEILTSVKSASEKLNKFLDSINNGNGTIATLVNDEKMSKEIKDTIVSLKDVSKDVKELTGKIRKVEVSWNTEIRNNSYDGHTRTDAGIIIAPKPDKRYILSINNISTDAPTVYDIGDQRYNSITALIEKDFGNAMLHGGSIRSSGGVGGGYKLTKKLGVGADVYRFDRKDKNGKDVPPSVDSYVSYNFVKWAKVKVGCEDAFEKSGVTASVNVTIKDEDISSLFGLIGLSRM